MFLDGHLLRLTHCIIDLGAFFYQFMMLTWHMTVNLFLFRKRKVQCLSSELTSKGNNMPKKLPRHVAFILTEKIMSYKDIANLIIWAIELGISYVSVYDPHGEVKRNDRILEDCIQQQKPGGSERFSSGNFHINKLSDIQEHSKDCDRIFNVLVWSLEDGKSGLAQLTQQLSKQVLTGHWSLNDIVPSKLDTLIQEKYGFPDPDLILQFGNTSTLAGFLPWHVRLSEILWVPTHHGLDYHSFLSKLVKYGRLQQRFGK